MGVCKSLVKTACLDEIFFHGRPVFVGVEPAEHGCWFLADKGDRLDRAAWLKKLAGWDALRYVVCDAGTVLQSALAWLAKQRRRPQGPRAGEPGCLPHDRRKPGVS